MKETIDDLTSILTVYSGRMNALDESDFSRKSQAAKWSKKEIVGHLIDSAHNNLRRFISGQYERTPTIIYDQDFWVTANGYQTYTKEDIIKLWRLVNEQIIHVLENMPEENYRKECNTSKNGTATHSLEWLAHDYVKHMKHHINQIIPGSFDIVYPS